LASKAKSLALALALEAKSLALALRVVALTPSLPIFADFIPCKFLYSVVYRL